MSLLKTFVALGADPKAKVIPQIPEKDDNNIIEPEEEQKLFNRNFKMPTKKIIEKKKSNKMFALSSAWHFVAQRPIKELVDYLKELNIPIDESNMLGNTPFSFLMRGTFRPPFLDFKSLYGIFKEKVNIDYQNSRGESPFLKLFRERNYEMASFLAKEGANVNLCDSKGNFALKYAVMSNDFQQAKMLLEEFHADPNIVDTMRRSALHYAINNSQPNIDSTSELEELLLDYGANVNAVDLRGRSPLHYAFVKIGNWKSSSYIDPIEAVTTLCSKVDIDVNVQDKWGKTPLHYAAQRGSTISTVFLLNRGADLEKKDIYSNSPLGIAFLYKHPDYAITLIERNADVSQLVCPQITKPEEEVEEKKEAESDEELFSDNEEKVEKEKLPWKKRMKKEPKRFDYPKYPRPRKAKKQQPPSQPEGLSVTDEPQSMFRVAIRMGWQGMLYLLLDKRYDYMLGMENALTEGKYQLLLNLLRKTAKDSVVQRYNDNDQNLIHILAMHGGNANLSQLQEIYKQFLKRGVQQMAVDIYGRTALHYAVIFRNLQMIKLLLEAGYEPNQEDNQGDTAIALLVKGFGIDDCGEILKELLRAGGNLNVSCKEDGPSGSIYTATPLIQLVRYLISKPHSFYELKNLLITFFEKGADCSLVDSNGRDVFMWAAMGNSVEILEILLKNARGFNAKQVDCYGKTAVHYAVKQFDIGSYQNSLILDILLTHRFEHSIPDKNGLTPVHYAASQANGKLIQVFRKHGIPVPESKPNVWPKNIRFLKDWELQFDYHQDAEKYLSSIEERLAQNLKAAVDKVGNEGEPLEVIYDAKENPYDVYMNKVNIKNGLYGEYVFYRMQLLHNTNRDVYFVYTRWGRIGEDGMFQKTPFGNKQEAEEEFDKIFKSKTGNNWEQKKEFKRHKHKYVAMALNDRKIQYKALLKPFNFKTLPHKSTLPKPLKHLFKLIVNIALYEKTMASFGIDVQQLPISRLKNETLNECRSLLEKLEGIIKELADEMAKGSEAKNDRLEQLYDECNELSSRYYELLPQEQYKEFKPPPICTQSALNVQISLIEDLINIESASKLLLAAQSRVTELNPLDYCYNSMGIELSCLEQNSEEFDIISRYINRSIIKESNNNYQQIKLKQIFAVQRRGELERFKPFNEMENKWLLFHGSRMSNFIGILAQGLRIAPTNTAITGWAFGKGIYFADMFSKSAGYCSGSDNQDLLMLVCEVALGKMSTPSSATFTNAGPPSGFDSVRVIGSKGPNMNNKLYLDDDSEIPIGEIIENSGKRTYVVAYNEYVVFNQDQVRIRYLIQWSR